MATELWEVARVAMGERMGAPARAELERRGYSGAARRLGPVYQAMRDGYAAMTPAERAKHDAASAAALANGLCN